MPRFKLLPKYVRGTPSSEVRIYRLARFSDNFHLAASFFSSASAVWKVILIPVSIIKRAIFITIPFNEYFIVQNRIFPFCPFGFEVLLIKSIFRNKKFIFDYDDPNWEYNVLWLKYFMNLSSQSNVAFSVSGYALKHCLESRFNVSSNKIAVINSINNFYMWPKLFPARKIIKDEDRICLGWIGSASTAGSLIKILQYLDRLWRPGIEFDLLILGVIEQGHARRIKNLVKGKVEFTNWSYEAEILLREMVDLALYGTLSTDYFTYRDGFKIDTYTVLGLPVLTYRCLELELGVCRTNVIYLDTLTSYEDLIERIKAISFELVNREIEGILQSQSPQSVVDKYIKVIEGVD